MGKIVSLLISGLFLTACSTKSASLLPKKPGGGSLQICDRITATVTQVSPDADKIYVNEPVGWRIQVEGCSGPFALTLSDGTRMEFSGNTHSFTTSYRQAGQVTEMMTVIARDLVVNPVQATVSPSFLVRTPVSGDLACAALNAQEVSVPLDGMGRMTANPVVPFNLISTDSVSVLGAELIPGAPTGAITQAAFPTALRTSHTVPILFSQLGGYLFKFRIEDANVPKRTASCLASVNIRGIDPVRPSCTFNIPAATIFRVGTTTNVDLNLTGPVASLSVSGAGISPLQANGPFASTFSFPVTPTTSGPRPVTARLTSPEGLVSSCVVDIAPVMTCDLPSSPALRAQLPDRSDTPGGTFCSGAQNFDLPAEASGIRVTFASVFQGVDDKNPAVKINGSAVGFGALFDSNVRVRAGRNVLRGQVEDTQGPNCRLAFAIVGSYDAYTCSHSLTTVCSSKDASCY